MKTTYRFLTIFTALLIVGFAGQYQNLLAQTTSPDPLLVQPERAPVQLPTPRYALPNIELAYLKSLHSKATAVNPTLSSILVGQFVNARQAKEGATFFAQLAKRSTGDTAVRYRTAGAVLRAAHANDVFILKRRAWVRETIDIFDASREALPDNMQIRWMVGTTLAQLPGIFKQKDNAKADLEWLMARLDRLPSQGLSSGSEREVFYQLACLYHEENNKIEAQRLLRLSGYKSFDREISIVSQFAASAENGLTMSIPRVDEHIPGKVFTASGFEMTEFHFVVSEDGSQTIAIDAGTRPDSAERAHQAVLTHFPDLPPVSTVLVTHTHWDHVGGHHYFRSLNPEVEFISRDNYLEELMKIRLSPPSFKYFFSKHYSNDSVADYSPDRTIATDTSITIGGTTVRAIPIPGGETKDGMFYHFPQHRVTFVGDFIMPYVGAPFANEGNPEGLLGSIEILTTLESVQQLHGHKPLTEFFNGVVELQKLNFGLQWLVRQVNSLRTQGLSMEQIKQRNLIPEIVFKEIDIQLPYFALRDGFISRLYTQSTGYWQTNLSGMDYLSQQDIGNVLKNYLNVSENRFTTGMKELLANGEYDTALKISIWARHSYPDSSRIEQQKQVALQGLRSKYQFTNPFKFLIYSELMDSPVPQLNGEWHSNLSGSSSGSAEKSNTVQAHSKHRR